MKHKIAAIVICCLLVASFALCFNVIFDFNFKNKSCCCISADVCKYDNNNKLGIAKVSIRSSNAFLNEIFCKNERDIKTDAVSILAMSNYDFYCPAHMKADAVRRIYAKCKDAKYIMTLKDDGYAYFQLQGKTASQYKKMFEDSLKANVKRFNEKHSTYKMMYSISWFDNNNKNDKF